MTKVGVEAIGQSSRASHRGVELRGSSITIASGSELKNHYNRLTDTKRCFRVGQRELCTHVARHILTKGGIDWAFERALNREASADEKRILAGLYKKSLTQFRAAPNSANTFVKVGESPVPPGLKTDELAAMTTVARVILNLHETITRN